MDLFDFSNPPINPIDLARDLTECMLEFNGLGLAANQVGLPYRVFTIKANPVLVCFNPRIVDSTTETVKLEEGCLTFPNLVLKVSRPKSIRCRFTLPNGYTDTYKYTGMTARIFQHEFDHLEGRLFTERVGPVSLTMAKEKMKKRDLL